MTQQSPTYCMLSVCWLTNSRAMVVSRLDWGLDRTMRWIFLYSAMIRAQRFGDSPVLAYCRPVTRWQSLTNICRMSRWASDIAAGPVSEPRKFLWPETENI